MLSQTRTLDIGAPQGCVLSALLFSLYTNDFISHSQLVSFFKYADDTTVVGNIKDGDESAYRAEVAAALDWCSANNLVLNLTKTKEMVIDFRKNTTGLPPLIIRDQPVDWVDSFKFLGTTICRSMKWEVNTNMILSKAHQRLHFLRLLRRFGVTGEAMVHFYRAAVESVLTFSVTVWEGNTTAMEKKQLDRVVHIASKITGRNLPTVSSIYTARTKRRMQKVMADTSHPARCLFKFLPSGRRLQSFKCKTSRLMNSTYPDAVRIMNSDPTLSALCNSLLNSAPAL